MVAKVGRMHRFFTALGLFALAILWQPQAIAGEDFAPTLVQQATDAGRPVADKAWMPAKPQYQPTDILQTAAWLEDVTSRHFNRTQPQPAAEPARPKTSRPPARLALDDEDLQPVPHQPLLIWEADAPPFPSQVKSKSYPVKPAALARPSVADKPQQDVVQTSTNAPDDASSRRSWREPKTSVELQAGEPAAVILEIMNDLGSLLEGTAFDDSPESKPERMKARVDKLRELQQQAHQSPVDLRPLHSPAQEVFYQAPPRPQSQPRPPRREKVHSLRQASRELEEIAHRLEHEKLYARADELRQLATELRHDARHHDGWSPREEHHPHPTSASGEATLEALQQQLEQLRWQLREHR